MYSFSTIILAPTISHHLKLVVVTIHVARGSGFVVRCLRVLNRCNFSLFCMYGIK